MVKTDAIDCIVVGTGGLCKQIQFDLFERYKNPVFFNDFDENYNLSVCSTIIKDINKLPRRESPFSIPFIITHSNPLIRKELTEKFIKLGYFPWYFMPIKHDFYDSIIEKNTIILKDCIIEPKTKIGFGTVINLGCYICHESKLGEYVTLGPRVTICGNIEVRENTFIGGNTFVREKIKIGKNVTIGCGSNVVSNIPDNAIAYGNPCKIIKFK